MAYIRKMKTGKWRAEIVKAGIRESCVFDELHEAQTWVKHRESEIQLIKVATINARRLAHRKHVFLNAQDFYSEHEIISMSTPIPPTCGVYFLIYQSSIVYVGQSINVYTRTAEHAKDKTFDRITVIECDEKDLDKLERFYISKFKPVLNIVGKNGNTYFEKVNEIMLT